MKPIIIVGAGLSGYTVAREFRKLDKTQPLLIITTDDGSFYSKPMLSNALAQAKSAQQLASQSAAQMATQLGASIHATTRVLTIDAANKTVTTSAGVHAFDKLVLAVGAYPIRIPMAGDAADQVLSVNHLDHYHDFRTRLTEQVGAKVGENKRRVAILGAGLIGCEFADDLAGAGHAVTLIDPNRLPLAAIAPPALSQGMADALRAKGIALEFGTTAQTINRVADGLQVQLANGSSITVDIVLSAVGLRPDLALAQAAGIATERGIVVDAYGQTSVADIYALGDCAEYTLSTVDRRTMPYIAPLMAAARAIARTLTGSATPIAHTPAPVIVKTPSYPLALLPPPLPMLAAGQWREAMQGDALVSRFFDANGIVQGFGVAPQQAALRQQLLSELGKPEVASALVE
jgi:rubredoxin-NAD+ reductase